MLWLITICVSILITQSTLLMFLISMFPYYVYIRYVIFDSTDVPLIGMVCILFEAVGQFNA